MITYNSKTISRKHRRKSSGPKAWRRVLKLEMKITIHKRKKKSTHWASQNLKLLVWERCCEKDEKDKPQTRGKYKPHFRQKTPIWNTLKNFQKSTIKE